MDPLQKLLDMATKHGLLHRIGAAPMKLRTSMVADDTALFLRAHALDVQHLHHLLQLFGAAIGLTTNITKSEIIPIRCKDLDLLTILGSFQATTAGLPCTYLRLPLRLGCLWKEGEQILIDRLAGKLPNWKGRLLNKAGHLMLVSSILPSIVTYHMTVFQLPKWAPKKIDRIRYFSYPTARDMATALYTGKGSRGRNAWAASTSWTLMGSTRPCASDGNGTSGSTTSSHGTVCR
jgi:hypothetical protein